MDQLELTFVLPKLIDHPVGGYKVHYQYANGLAQRGHSVTLLHAISAAATPTALDRLRWVRATLRQRRPGRPPIGWFEFHRSIRSVIVPVVRSSDLPRADCTILTAWQTSERTVAPPIRAGAIYQVVYDYEFWMSDTSLRPAMKEALGRRDVRHVATSGVVAEMLREIGTAPVATITAGLSEGEFGVDAPIEERDAVVGFARRFQPSKDAPSALAAVRAVHEAMPNARIVTFGGAPDPLLPGYVEDLGRLTHTELRAFYNRCKVFLLTSRFEGWGLPALEAMACGAAVVSTRSGGVEDFLRDGDNGLLVPVADPEAIATAAMSLLTNDDRRTAIARRAAVDATQLTMQRSIDQLEAVLLGTTDPTEER